MVNMNPAIEFIAEPFYMRQKTHEHITHVAGNIIAYSFAKSYTKKGTKEGRQVKRIGAEHVRHCLQNKIVRN